jgi:calcineurin-like phosphoesterase family protein
MSQSNYIPKLWVISDTHWNHRRMIELCGRPQNFDALINENWKRQVDERDTVIHLGDVILGQNGTLKDILASLPGRKIMVRGNHDHESNGWYERQGFHYVCGGLLHRGVWYSHYPATSLPDGALVNVHGHTHNNPYPVLPHHRLISLELNGYNPVLVDMALTGISQEALNLMLW